jgi:N-formylglutamate amidohydrolase
LPSSNDVTNATAPTSADPVEVLRPKVQTLPLVLASPHSGKSYRPDFLAASRLDLATLRRSEDAHVDALFSRGQLLGAPLLRALFPRSFVDPNREAYELDPLMFDAPLPSYVNTLSDCIAAGLGTIAKVICSGEEIYREKLHFDDAKQRITSFHIPYHKALESLVEKTEERFGICLLLDCHSMPSIGGPMDRDHERKRADMVLGDRHGTSCAAQISEAAKQCLEEMGFSVLCNEPYAGGFTTRHYGRKNKNTHALQIEINRALYMDEKTLTPNETFDGLSEKLSLLVKTLAETTAGLRAQKNGP